MEHPILIITAVIIIILFIIIIILSKSKKSGDKLTYQKYKDQFPKPEEKEPKETVVVYTTPNSAFKTPPKAGPPRRRPITKVKGKTVEQQIQEQIDAEHARLSTRPGVSGDTFKVKLSEDWMTTFPIQDDPPKYAIGIDSYRTDDDTTPSATTKFGRGSFGAGGASGSWEPETKSDDSHNHSSDNNDTSSDSGSGGGDD